MSAATLNTIQPVPGLPRSVFHVASLIGCRWRRGSLLLIVAAAFVAGFLVTDSTASAHAVGMAGADLTRLLRAMAALKLLFVGGAVGAVIWRAGAPVTAARAALYAASCGAMAMGPGLIWGMAHVGAGALLLHGGLLCTALLLWRDPAVGQGLAELVVRRRQQLAQRETATS
jgi:hypothetical protein